MQEPEFGSRAAARETMLCLLAARCVAGVPSALSPLAADEVDPLLLSPNVRAALFASSAARVVPDKKCTNAAGDAAWCTDENASKISNATTPSDSRNATRSLRRKAPPKKNCADPNGQPVYCHDAKAVNASLFEGQAIKPGMDPQGCTAVAGGGATDGWCRENCGDAKPNCPPTMCACSSAKVIEAERKTEKSALPLGGDPSTCKSVSEEAASTDAWCIQNCGDENPLCPPDLCVCSQTAKLPVQPKEAEAGAEAEAPTEGSVRMVSDTGAEETVLNKSTEPRQQEQRAPVAEIALDTANGGTAIDAIADMIIAALYLTGGLVCHNASGPLMSTIRFLREYRGYTLAQREEMSQLQGVFPRVIYLHLLVH